MQFLYLLLVLNLMKARHHLFSHQTLCPLVFEQAMFIYMQNGHLLTRPLTLKLWSTVLWRVRIPTAQGGRKFQHPGRPLQQTLAPLAATTEETGKTRNSAGSFC